MSHSSAIPCPTAGSLIAPLFLRVVIGLTFLWAGLGKLTTTMEVSGESAAMLANMGVVAVKPLTPPVLETPTDLPFGNTPDRQPIPTEPLTEPSTDPDVGPAKPQGTPKGTPTPLMRLQASPSQTASTPSDTAPKFVAQDFETPVAVTGVYGIALLIKYKSEPSINADGTNIRPILPAKLGEGRWPVYLAWSAAVTEVVAGAMMLAGLFTRLGAFALMGTMVMATWLTEIGPAMAAGTAKLGFLPAHDWFGMDAAGNYAMANFGWQMALLAGSAALVFLGGGYLSLDRLLFPRKGYVVESKAIEHA